MKLSCATGTAIAFVTQKFADGATIWQIARFGEHGGETTVFCRPIVHEHVPWFFDRIGTDGTVELCGDSVAARLLTANDGRPRDARGNFLKERT